MLTFGTAEVATEEEAPLALSSTAMGFLQRHTCSVVQDLKLPFFLTGRLRSHLVALSHFTDEEMKSRSVKSASDWGQKQK